MVHVLGVIGLIPPEELEELQKIVVKNQQKIYISHCK